METANNIATTEMEQTQKNGAGMAGFIMAIFGLIFCWVPTFKWILLIPAFIFSLTGARKSPKALAVIGAIISGFVILILLVIKLVKAAFWGAMMSL